MLDAVIMFANIRLFMIFMVKTHQFSQEID